MNREKRKEPAPLSRYRLPDEYTRRELKLRYESAAPSGRIRLLKSLFQNSESPPNEILSFAVKDSSVMVRAWLARNATHLDNSKYFDLAKCDFVVTNPELNFEAALREDPDPYVRASLFENSSLNWPFTSYTGEEEAVGVFQKASHLERLALMRNPQIIPEYALRIFDLADKDFQVDIDQRGELCLAFITNYGALGKLADKADRLENGPMPEDGMTYVGWKHDIEALDKMWKCLDRWPEGKGGDVRFCAYKFLKASAATKTESFKNLLGKDGANFFARAILEGCSDNDNAVFEVALKSSNSFHREVAVARIKLTPEILKTILESKDEELVKELGKNPSFDKSLLKMLEDHALGYKQDDELRSSLRSAFFAASNRLDPNDDESDKDTVTQDSEAALRIEVAALKRNQVIALVILAALAWKLLF